MASSFFFCPDKLILLGDFNARVGTDLQTWEEVIGTEGVGKCKSNGLLLLRKCAEHELLITKTVFHLPTHNKTSWVHPGSKHWRLIDYVIVLRKDRQDVRGTKTMCGTEYAENQALSGGVSATLQSGLILENIQRMFFAVNLGYRDNVHEFWQKTFSKCSWESDQIVEQHLHRQKELDFPHTLCFIWTNSIRYKLRYSKKILPDAKQKIVTNSMHLVILSRGFPTLIYETVKAIRLLSSGKAPGSDAIYKAGGPPVTVILHYVEKRSHPSRIQGCSYCPPIQLERESSSLLQSLGHLFIVSCWE